jgi:hypothetical protein
LRVYIWQLWAVLKTQAPGFAEGMVVLFAVFWAFSIALPFTAMPIFVLNLRYKFE